MKIYDHKPLDFMIIPVIFYAVVAAAGLDLTMLRREGWIFDMGGSSESWFKFYSYFSKRIPGLIRETELTIC